MKRATRSLRLRIGNLRLVDCIYMYVCMYGEMCECIYAHVWRCMCIYIYILCEYVYACMRMCMGEVGGMHVRIYDIES